MQVISNARVTRRRRSKQAADDPATEFKVLQNLSDHPHQNLLSLVDKFEDDKKVYFVMPLASGGDLLSSVERHSNGLSDSLTRDILKQLVGALQHLHKLGWQHGDISLENILLMSPGDFSCVTLCDFGLAARMGSPGRSVGKSMYMSPEEIATANLYSTSTPTKFSTSAAQDIFSLGVSMFITLFGFPPFDVARDTDLNYRTLSINKEKYLGNLKKWGVPESKVRLPIVTLLIDMMDKDAAKRPTLTNILEFLARSIK